MRQADTRSRSRAARRRVPAAVESRRIPGPDGRDLQATVSAGCAALDPLDPTREALIRTADVGLYLAKRGGRNRVVAA